jgi:hypothetical protein
VIGLDVFFTVEGPHHSEIPIRITVYTSRSRHWGKFGSRQFQIMLVRRVRFVDSSPGEKLPMYPTTKRRR